MNQGRSTTKNRTAAPMGNWPPSSSHEVAHVNHRDGIVSISQARWTQVVTSLGYDPAGFADLLGRMTREQTGGSGNGEEIFTTRPGMAERLDAACSAIARNGWKKLDHKIRDRRFEQYL
jgi:hypothetical protein